MRLLAGTSGYNFDEWKGTFYPEKFPSAKMLAYYAERLPTVEVNYTFYRMPNAKTIAGWVEQTPAGFTFVLKASQKITHFKRLKEVESELRYFCDTALQLGPKLGAMLFQLPPNFKKETERLGEVLRLVPEENPLRLGVPQTHHGFPTTSITSSRAAMPPCASPTRVRAPRPT